MASFHQVPNRYLAPPKVKDYYDVFYTLLTENKIKKVLDIGTASGDFLYFLPDQISALGIDSSPELIDEANRSRKKSNLEFQAIEFEEFFPGEYFDAITILGTLLTVEDWANVITKCIQMRPKLILIHDVFNPEPIDVKLGFRNSQSSNGEFNFGYNVVSIESLRELYKSHQVNHEISRFNMKTELYKDTLNPMYNYHADLNGERILTNGTGLVLRMYNVIAYLDRN
jgi:SAM-dependent methyltransferase